MTGKRTVAGGLATMLTSALAGLAAGPAAAGPLAPERQAANMALSGTRGRDLTPELMARVVELGAQRGSARLALAASDPERRPDPNLCTLPACVGDPRLYDWADGKGVVEPVLFTARSGATLSGRVWATKHGLAKRPGVVIVNGSIVGYEEVYWWAAQTLAKAGFVVLTFDAQGEGESDQLGAAPDELESKIAGAPPFGDGGPFYDGGTDALDFLLSTPAHPYVPRPSRTSGTSHADKQSRRVTEGRNAAFNPLHQLLDPQRIGITGHSFGAYAASYIAQADRRVDAVVAWDTLCVPRNSTRTELEAMGDPRSSSATTLAGIPVPPALYALPGDECMGAPPQYAPDVPLRVPALGITSDYVAPVPFTQAPERDFKARVSGAYSQAGIDSGQLVIRGGNHVEWSWAPIPAGTLRGVDLSAWYTAAWFDRYLKDDPSADARLLSSRWRDDARGKAVDPSGDPNVFSELYRSRMDIHTTGGARVSCEDLRAGCPQLRPAAGDCGPADFGYAAVATRPDDGSNPLVADCASRPRAWQVCTPRRRLTITLPRAIRRIGVRRLRVRVGGRAARATRDRRGRVRVVLPARAVRPSGVLRVRIVVRGRDGRVRWVVRRYRACG